jgi:two-component system sensor histidine kinase FlrB
MRTASAANPQVLADAFAEFIAASSQLEGSYRSLQQEISVLSGELADRNAALRRSLAENERIRLGLQQMIEAMPCGVLVADENDSVIIINPEGRRLLCLGERRIYDLAGISELSGIDFAKIQRAPYCEEGIEVCIGAGQREYWLAIRKRALESSAISDAGLDPCCIWTMQDISVAKRAEREREGARRATILAEISSILAHEIRNPLASLELFAGLIGSNPSENEAWVSHLRAGIRALSGTVNNVLSMNGESRPHLSPIDLVESVRRGTEFVRPLASQAEVDLVFVSGVQELRISGNEDAIRQNLLNLIGNGLRHTAAGGVVRVEVERGARDGQGLALVRVSDNGCGIPEEQMGRLFDAGFSGNGKTTGLGLAVCRQFMENHGGSIRVKSKVGEGSTFEMEFPEL